MTDTISGSVVMQIDDGGVLRTLTREDLQEVLPVASVSKGNAKLTLAGASALVSSVSGGIPAGATKVRIQPVSDVHMNDDGTAADVNDYLISGGTEWLYDYDKLAQVRLFGSGDVYLWFEA